MTNFNGSLKIVGTKGFNGTYTVDPAIVGKMVTGELKTSRPVEINIKTPEGVRYVEDLNPNMKWQIEI